MFHTCINLFPPRPIQAVQGYQFSTYFCSWYLLIHFIWKLKEVVFQHKFCISLDTLCVFLLSNASLIACRSAWCSMVGLRLTTSAATKIAFFFLHPYLHTRRFCFWKCVLEHKTLAILWNWIFSDDPQYSNNKD